MQIYKGKGVCGGTAVGRASVMVNEKTAVIRVRIEDADAELARLDEAVRSVEEQLDELYMKALPEVGEAGAQIFEIHKMMLRDEDFLDCIRGNIRRQQINAEYAAALAADNFEAMFAASDDSYMEARAADVREVADRLIRVLSGRSDKTSVMAENTVICASDLAPGETVTLDKSRVIAFVTAGGSVNSHTAILARSMNIPAVIGVGEGFLASVSDGADVIVNGSSGEVIISPDGETLAEAKVRREEELAAAKLLDELRGKENITRGGQRIDIFANIGGVEDIGAVLLCDAGGIGLFRSEFLYLGKDRPPSEDEQLAAYRRVLEAMGGKKTVIRTLDIGADKRVPYLGLDEEENPALGLRALRLCLTDRELFKTQLRALWRASVYGKLSVMFPMVTSVRDVVSALSVCGEVRAELRESGIETAEDIEIGIMIETPAAAVIADKLAPLVDFFSVGTNDLTQYTLACDRQNPALDSFCDTHHEAVLRLIAYAAKCAHAEGKWIGICGELAADTALTESFIKMGIDELSVSPSSVLTLRRWIRSLDI